MAQVTLEKVTKVYPGGVRAVDEVDLTIHEEEFIVLVGPSGCGKSTTLRMIAGLEEITGGTIRIGDKVVNDVAPKNRDIAMVFQNYALYPHMSVYRNMAFGLKLRGTPRKQIDEAVQNAAQILGITDLLNRRPKALSGGQRQRVAVGRAIVRDPACFLFDEPLSNLDAKLRVETRAELKSLHQRLKTTTVYVTHDQEEAMTLGQRIVVMSEGKVQQCDTPLTVFNQPANRFVAGFVGTPPMNFMDGRLDAEGDGLTFTGAGVSLPMDAARVDRLARHAGQPVVLGLRPDHVALRADAAGPDAAAMSVTVNVVEPLGTMMDLFVQTTAGQSFVARVRAEPVEPGVQLELHVDMGKVSVFAPGPYGDNLTSNASASAAAV